MRCIATLLTASLLISACDKSAVVEEAPRIMVKDLKGTATIHGKINYTGKVFEPKIIRNQPCCTGAPKELNDESFILNKNSTLCNVVVYLKDGPRANGCDMPPVILDQVFCQYVPHIAGVVVGQVLRIRSSDATVHNVHYKPSTVSPQNFTMTKAGDSVDTSFPAPEFIHTVCDIHPWMGAYIAVLDNPYFCITNETGEFEISNIPQGKYTLVAWHEMFGKLEQTVEITPASNTVELNFTYSPPKE